jgi:hypothetical protein
MKFRKYERSSNQIETVNQGTERLSVGFRQNRSLGNVLVQRTIECRYIETVGFGHY